MFNKLKKNTFLASVVTLTSGTAIAQAITVLASPIITRLYTPADMGLLANFTAITAILGVVATGTYDQAIVLPDDDKDANALVLLGGGIVIVFGVIVTIIFIFFNEFLVAIFNLRDIPNIWVYGIGFFVVLIGFDAILSRLATRRRQFKVQATTAVAQQVGMNGVKIGTGFLDMRTSGLLSATVLGYLVREIRLIFTQRDFLFSKKNHPGFDGIKKVTVRYKKFPLFASWSSLLNTASTQLPVVMFASLFSAGIAGYYALSHRILSLPMSLIGKSVGQVFIERASKVRGDADGLKRITFEAYKKLFLIGFAIMSFVMFYGDILFPLVFGSEWLVAGQYAQWISIWLVFVFVASPLSNIYIVLEKQTEFLFVNIVMFISRIGVIFFALFIKMSDVNMIAGFSILGAILCVCMCFRILKLVHVSSIVIVKTSLVVVIPIGALQLLFSFLLRSVL